MPSLVRPASPRTPSPTTSSPPASRLSPSVTTSGNVGTPSPQAHHPCNLDCRGSHVSPLPRRQRTHEPLIGLVESRRQTLAKVTLGRFALPQGPVQGEAKAGRVARLCSRWVTQASPHRRIARSGRRAPCAAPHALPCPGSPSRPGWQTSAGSPAHPWFWQSPPASCPGIYPLA